MNTMRPVLGLSLAGLLALAVMAPLPALAQGPAGAQVVTNCGSMNYAAGSIRLPTQTQTGRACVNSSTNAATHAQSAALASNLPVKTTGAGTLYSFTVSADTTLNAAQWYVMVFDATALPADGAVTPAKCYAVPAGAPGAGGTFDTGGVAFANGIVIGVSTTGCFTKTASTHALFIGADYQ